jgi:glycosyltransferase involved in cell wall biosynthesis
MSHDVLLTVSGVIPPDIAAQISAGGRPEADYLALARAFGADLLDYPAARRMGGRLGRFLEKIGGPNLALAWACFRLHDHYRVIFTDGEQVGIPLALLLKLFAARRRPRHLMIGHLLSAGKKMLFFDWLGLQGAIDLFLVYSTWQQRFVQERWRLPPERVVFTPFMVDAHFFAPERASPERWASADFAPPAGEWPIICSAGLEFRDYPTLITGVRGLDVRVVLAAASPWSKRADTTQGQALPPNVLVRRFSQHELRDLYAASQIVVMPLYDVTFQAGVTAILEAMAMGRPVICSRTAGQTDVVVEGVTGLYVPPGDPRALREAIAYLLANPEVGRQMGQAGRERVEREMSLERYVARLSHYVGDDHAGRADTFQRAVRSETRQELEL